MTPFTSLSLVSRIKAKITAVCPCGRAAKNKAGPTGAPTVKPEFVGGAALVRLQQAQVAAKVEKIARDAMELARACMDILPGDEAMLAQPMLTCDFTGSAWEAAAAESRSEMEKEADDDDDAASLGSCAPLLRAYWNSQDSFSDDEDEVKPSPPGERAANGTMAEAWWV